MNKIKFNATSDGLSGYIYLPNHPGEGFKGCAVKQVRLAEVLKSSVDFEIYIDLDQDGNPIGIEIESD